MSDIYFDRESHQFVGINDLTMKKIQEAYPKKDIQGELNKMKLWLMSDKGKTRKGALAFIMNWLGNAPDVICKVSEAPKAHDEVIQAPLGKYLNKLWKKNERLLQSNTLVSSS
jgi:hypothetical protein